MCSPNTTSLSAALPVVTGLYTTVKCTYMSITHPFFSKSDHLSVMQLPVYKQKLKISQLATRTIQCWTTEYKSRLQDCLESTDWSIIRGSSGNLDEFTDSIIDYVRFCMD